MFYERLKQLCKMNREKPCNVLSTLDISTGNLSNWKRGMAVKSDILIRIADYFNVSVDYLLDREEQITANANADNSTVSEVNTGKQYDETAIQVAEEFSKLSFSNKIKVMNLISELNDERGG